MHIIIPMSGVGQRFLDAGYTDIKPLIPVDGKPIIEHVVSLFDSTDTFTFICNEDHLTTSPLSDVLKRIAPEGNIISIAPHKKGPVYAVAQVFDHIDDTEEVIVNYCDFAKYWDYTHFLKHTRGRKADGAVTAYKGFHPHMLGKTNYAFIKDEGQWLTDIQEKKPFTNERMNEYASDGTYYFRTGKIVKTYFQKLMDKGPDLNGEYYVSLAYKHMAADDLNISVYGVQHMLQWGEPHDLEQYKGWSAYFKDVLTPADKPKAEHQSINLIPLAGRGSRFTAEGFKNPKPLIEISGEPMIIQASRCLPEAEKRIFICLGDHLAEYPLRQAIEDEYSDANILALDEPTEGQACTCEIGLIDEEPLAPVTIGACDNAMVWDPKKFQELVDDITVECVVFTFRNHPSSALNPHMYGWCDVDSNNIIKRVSVKQPISDDPYHDHAIIGAFYFRRVKHFIDALERLYKEDVRINDEFYVDSCIQEIVNAGLTAKVLEVDHYIGWGTPDDYRTFSYWQSFFHKCDWHPYTLEDDPTMNQDKCVQYDKAYRSFTQEYE